MTMWIKRLTNYDLRDAIVNRNSSIKDPKDMAYPARLVFTPFVVVVGSKYFLPVPECLIF